MHDLNIIIKACRELRASTEKLVLATVVDVVGSAYRRPGARMLILESGRTVGTISGGCLEADVALRARHCFETGQSTVLHYSTSASDDVVFGLGLGCNGSVAILVQPLDLTDAENPIQLIERGLSARECGILLTAFCVDGDSTLSAGDCQWMASPTDHTANCERSPEKVTLASLVREDAHRAMESGASRARTYECDGGKVSVLIEFVQPPIHLIVCGAGYDALPTVSIAKHLGWRVTVVDPRAAYAVPERFQLADETLVLPADSLHDRIRFDQRTAAVIMTHNYMHDLNFLKHLATRDLAYLGVLGPKLRTTKLVTELSAEAATATIASAAAETRSCHASLMALKAPVGLDIGAETAEEIALSIVAEIQAVFTGHEGGFLRDREGPIHRVSDGDVERERNAAPASAVAIETKSCPSA